MAFWSDNSITPLRKRSFTVSIPAEAGGFEFLVKSANKPTVETDVNEYRLINQIVKFPTVPKWNDITIKYVDTDEKSTTAATVTAAAATTTRPLPNPFPHHYLFPRSCCLAAPRVARFVLGSQLNPNTKTALVPSFLYLLRSRWPRRSTPSLGL